jgi:hypothetical protein
MAEKKEKRDRPGRPPLPDHIKRREVIQIRLNADEKKALMELASRSTGGTVANLVREKIINAGGADAWHQDAET